MYCPTVQLILLLVISDSISASYWSTARNDTLSSGLSQFLPRHRTKRSPADEFPENLEAMIIDERGKFIHLQWKKEERTLVNKFLPVWTAHCNDWGTVHKSRNDLMQDLDPFITYYDLEQRSAVVYNSQSNTLSGSIDTSYILEHLPLKLLHQCHRMGTKYVRRNTEQSHGVARRPRPSRSDIERFENCYDTSRSSTTNRAKKREVQSENHNITRIRQRRGADQPHFYLEILLLVKYDLTIAFKNIHHEKYLQRILHYHLYQFTMVDMIFAQLRQYGLNIHINIAGVIIEEDAEAFYLVTELPQNSRDKGNLHESMSVKFSRYLNYHDLPFGKDSIDLIYMSMADPSFFRAYYPLSFAQPVGLTWPMFDMYQTRQLYKDTNFVSLVTVLNTNIYMSACSAAHEIGHALHLDHDRQTFGPGSRHLNCDKIMQEQNPHCFHCIRWSKRSVKQLKKFTQDDRDRCFLLNFPRSLHSPGPRKGLSPCEQCHCYGYKFYGDKPDECLLKIPASGCAKRLQCHGPEMDLSPDEPTILPLDGTPCGDNKVCWQGNCVEIEAPE